MLVDGRRTAPVNGQLVVDLNTIPAGMIDHVEAITGGASAVYGADAVGGVVNFIMKKNFHGVDLDASYAINQAGDGKQFQVNALFGTNFADDRGNITINIERLQSDPVKQSSHKFFTDAWKDPTTAGSFFPFGTALATDLNPPSQAAVNAAMPKANPPATTLFFTDFYVKNNTIYTGLSGLFGTSNPGGSYAYPDPIDGNQSAYTKVASGGQIVQGVKTNATVGYVQAPLSRWSFFTDGHYDFNNDLTAFFQTNFAQTTTNQILTAPVSIVSGWNAFIPYDSATGGAASGHPVPSALAALLNSRAAPNAPWELSWIPSTQGPLPPRQISATNSVFNITAGLDGKLSGNDFTKDWTWELYGQHSQSQEYDVAGGDYSLVRFQQLILAQNWGQGAAIKGNQTQPNGLGNGGTIAGTSPGFGAATGTCTSGFYNVLFNGGSISQDCLNSMSAPLQSMNTTTQDVVEFDLQGTLYKLPAGDLKFSFGGDYRRDQLVYNPDILQSVNSFADQVIGVYPTAYENAADDVKEGYAELNIPVLADLPFIKAFTLQPGARYSSYSGSPGGWTYKLMADWEINDWARFRGGYNLAVRAPNLAELYQPATQFYGAGSSYADGCSLLSNSPYGAGGAVLIDPSSGNQVQPYSVPGSPAVALGPVVNTKGQAGANSAALICQALMGSKPGQTSTGAGAYYLSTAQAPASSGGFAFVNQAGNPNLDPEEARTWTGGLVLRSPFQNNPWLQRAQITVDYYTVHISHAIEYASYDYIYQNCLSQSVGSLAQAITLVNSNAFCQDIVRSPASGGAGLTLTPDQNLATIDTAGTDIQFNWSLPLEEVSKKAPGIFSVSVLANVLDHYNTRAAPGLPEYKWYGSFGPTLAGLDGGAFAWKLNTTFTYAVGPANISLNWRHLPPINSTGFVTTPTANHTIETAAYDTFDLNLLYNLPHGLQLRGGIQNLLDSEPPVTGATTPTSAGGVLLVNGSSGLGTTASQFYDTNGRRFYVGIKARF